MGAQFPAWMYHVDPKVDPQLADTPAAAASLGEGWGTPEQVEAWRRGEEAPPGPITETVEGDLAVVRRELEVVTKQRDALQAELDEERGDAEHVARMLADERAKRQGAEHAAGEMAKKLADLEDERVRMSAPGSTPPRKKPGPKPGFKRKPKAPTDGGNG